MRTILIVLAGLIIGCGGKDNSADSDTQTPCFSQRVQLYLDADGDGFGDVSTMELRDSCDDNFGRVENWGDCDDTDAAINPHAEEVCDGVDNDCDGTADYGLRRQWYPDVDGDGYGFVTQQGEYTCEPGEGYVDNNDDCDDYNSAINPDAEEVCDGVDNNCDGNVNENLPGTDCYDDDGDGQTELEGDCDDSDASLESNDLDGDGYTTCDGDCDDGEATIYPFADESAECESSTPVDRNCDGSTGDVDDADGDGVRACLDCDDSDARAYPNNTFPMQWDDCIGDRAQLDNDCDGIENRFELGCT